MMFQNNEETEEVDVNTQLSVPISQTQHSQSYDENYGNDHSTLIANFYSKTPCNTTKNTKKQLPITRLLHSLPFSSYKKSNIRNLIDFSIYTKRDKRNKESQESINDLQTKTQRELSFQKQVSTLNIPTLNKNKFTNLSNLFFDKSSLKCDATISKTNLFIYKQDLNVHTNGQDHLSILLPFQKQDIYDNTDLNFSIEPINNNNSTLFQQNTDFEKLNREYLSIRKYQNPIIKSLKRVDLLNSKKKTSSTQKKKKSSTNSSSLLDCLSDMINDSKKKLDECVFSMDQKTINEINMSLDTLWLETDIDLPLFYFSSPKKKFSKK